MGYPICISSRTQPTSFSFLSQTASSCRHLLLKTKYALCVHKYSTPFSAFSRVAAIELRGSAVTFQGLYLCFLLKIKNRISVMRYVVLNGRLWDDLYIGFQNRISRDPDVYHHRYTNICCFSTAWYPLTSIRWSVHNCASDQLLFTIFTYISFIH